MNKIIIENRSKKTMEEAIEMVRQVIKVGRVSKTAKGKQYCFATVWPDETAVYADRNKRSDKFVVAET